MTLSHLLDRAWILIENSQRIGESGKKHTRFKSGSRREEEEMDEGWNTRKVYWYRCNVSTQVRGPWPGRSRFTAFDGARRKRGERRCDHGCKDLSRTCLSSLSRLMSLFRNVHVRFPAGCTGCNEWPVPRLDRSTPSERGCNRDPKTLIPKNRRIPFLFIAEENKICCFEKRDFWELKVPVVHVEHDRLYVKIFSLKAWN